VLDMLLLPHQCNPLHRRCSAVIELALIRGGKLREALLDAQLASRLVSLLHGFVDRSTADAAVSASLPVLPSCHGYAMAICAALASSAKEDEVLRAHLEASDGWIAFAGDGGALSAWEGVQSKPLGGRVPMRGDDDSDDDEVYFDTEAVERALEAQQARQAALDGDGQEEAPSSSEYLNHFSEYLKQKNPFESTEATLDALESDTLETEETSPVRKTSVGDPDLSI